MKEEWKIHITEDATGDLVRVIGPYKTKRQAEKALAGVLLNMNHAEYSAEVRSNTE